MLNLLYSSIRHLVQQSKLSLHHRRSVCCTAAPQVPSLFVQQAIIRLRALWRHLYKHSLHNWMRALNLNSQLTQAPGVADVLYTRATRQGIGPAVVSYPYVKRSVPAAQNVHNCCTTDNQRCKCCMGFRHKNSTRICCFPLVSGKTKRKPKITYWS